MNKTQLSGQIRRRRRIALVHFFLLRETWAKVKCQAGAPTASTAALAPSAALAASTVRTHPHRTAGFSPDVQARIVVANEAVMPFPMPAVIDASLQPRVGRPPGSKKCDLTQFAQNAVVLPPFKMPKEYERPHAGRKFGDAQGVNDADGIVTNQITQVTKEVMKAIQPVLDELKGEMTSRMEKDSEQIRNDVNALISAADVRAEKNSKQIHTHMEKDSEQIRNDVNALISAADVRTEKYRQAADEDFKRVRKEFKEVNTAADVRA